MQSVGASSGFNPQVEKEYSQKNNLQAQFALLDNEIMPKPSCKADLAELAVRVAAFKKEGGLDR